MKARRLIALILACVLLTGCGASELPVSPFAPQEETVPAEDPVEIETSHLEYIPVFPEKTPAQESVTDQLTVHVTAVNRETMEEEPVFGASVRLFVGAEERETVPTDQDGNAVLSLDGLTVEEKSIATVSADHVVSWGMAIADNSGRSTLFDRYPVKHRYTMELHSESIDAHGNWVGVPVPDYDSTNKVDVAFAIDSSGSMQDEIDNVRDNLVSFSAYLQERGLDVRFFIVDFRDCNEYPTSVHDVGGSQWIEDVDAVQSELRGIEADGGNSDPETPLDALGYIARPELIDWRSDAHKFTFLMTDEPWKWDNNHGFADLEEVAEALRQQEVVTSVITSQSLKSDYAVLYEDSQGIWANINGDFDAEMRVLAESIVEGLSRTMELQLHEPRMLVNLSLCYFADDEFSRGPEYLASLKEMLKRYSLYLAQATDGHVLVDQMFLFSTDDRLDFYTTSEPASMADIRIEYDTPQYEHSEEYALIDQTSSVFGFFRDDAHLNLDVYADNFAHVSELLQRWTYGSIRMGSWWATRDAADVITFLREDTMDQYVRTLVHETGHYLFGFRDEYADGNGNTFDRYHDYGLMENQNESLELSRTAAQYTQLQNLDENADTDFDEVFRNRERELHTEHSWDRLGSCEDVLADLLTGRTLYSREEGSWGSYVYELPEDYADTGRYLGTYQKNLSTTMDRTAEYPYAELTEEDIVMLAMPQTQPAEEWEFNVEPYPGRLDFLSDFSLEPQPDGVIFSFVPQTDGCTMLLRKAGQDTYLDVPLRQEDDRFTAAPEILPGELAELYLLREDGAEAERYYIDRSPETDTGYVYTSADAQTSAVVLSEDRTSFCFLTDPGIYTQNDYTSVGQATWISCETDTRIDGGEIYSTAALSADIDFTTLSWFCCRDGQWKQLETRCTKADGRSVGAGADLDGAGLYVLMAKKAPSSKALPADLLTCTPSDQKDAVVTLSFRDRNENSKFYNLYYSETPISDKDADQVAVRAYGADSQDLTVNLLTRGRAVWAAVEIILEDGSRSPLSEQIQLVAGEADSDGDGIPDWYNDQYLLWGADGMDIAGSDADGDGLSNLEEYNGGSDPRNPNDPVHTTNIPVEAIHTSETAVQVRLGETLEVTAQVEPANATRQEIRWKSEDMTVASVRGENGSGLITGEAEGETTVYAVSADGGYAAAVTVTVTDKPTYTVSYDCNGGKADGGEYEPETAEAGTTIVVRDAVSRKGYRFRGWLSNGELYATGTELPVEGDIVLTAQWDINWIEYLILLFTGGLEE